MVVSNDIKRSRMERFKEDFPGKLKNFNLEPLESSKHSIYALSNDLKFIYFNPAWFQFAEENGLDKETLQKFKLGTSISKAIYGIVTRSFYNRKYRKVIASGKNWYHDYECSSKKEFRFYHQGVYPLKEKAGILVINSLMFKLPMNKMNRDTFMAIEERYIQSEGHITHCSNCKHTLRADKPEHWDWVPTWAEKAPANSKLILCPTCTDFYMRS